jgi:hypothetical protein
MQMSDLKDLVVKKVEKACEDIKHAFLKSSEALTKSEISNMLMSDLTEYFAGCSIAVSKDKNTNKFKKIQFIQIGGCFEFSYGLGLILSPETDLLDSFKEDLEAYIKKYASFRMRVSYVSRQDISKKDKNMYLIVLRVAVYIKTEEILHFR